MCVCMYCTTLASQITTSTDIANCMWRVRVSHIPAGQLHLRVEYQCAPLTGPVTVVVNFPELTM